MRRPVDRFADRILEDIKELRFRAQSTADMQNLWKTIKNQLDKAVAESIEEVPVDERIPVKKSWNPFKR